MSKPLLTEFGIHHSLESCAKIIQATRPDTLGFGLATSPLGLAAYIVEKFVLHHKWKSTSNGLELSALEASDMFTLDELLDNLMVYWLTGSITSSVRFYKENVARPENLELTNSYQK